MQALLFRNISNSYLAEGKGELTIIKVCLLSGLLHWNVPMHSLANTGIKKIAGNFLTRAELLSLTFDREFAVVRAEMFNLLNELE